MESGQDNEALSPGSEVRKQTLEPLASPTYLTVKYIQTLARRAREGAEHKLIQDTDYRYFPYNRVYTEVLVGYTHLFRYRLSSYLRGGMVC